MSDEEKSTTERVLDRRQGGDRRKTVIDPADLPFPDRRRGGDRRQMDRRVLSEEEREALKKIVVPDTAATEEKAPE
jgi:hypothetical protein